MAQKTFYGFKNPEMMNIASATIINEKYNGVYKLPKDSNLRVNDHYDTVTVVGDRKLWLDGIEPDGTKISERVSEDICEWTLQSLEIYECLTQTENGKPRKITGLVRVADIEFIKCY